MLDTTDPDDSSEPHTHLDWEGDSETWLSPESSLRDSFYSLGKMASKGFPFLKIKESAAKWEVNPAVLLRDNQEG